jgi:hypothetical protein
MWSEFSEPAHRWAHTFVIGTFVGAAAGLAVTVARNLARANGLPTRHAAEVDAVPCLVGGTLGGATHAFLDGLKHSAIQPLCPFTNGNLFLGLVSLMSLYVFCVLAGAAGLILIVRRGRSK